MGGVTQRSTLTRQLDPLQRIDALIAESEWLVADDRWTEEEFRRLWLAGLEASGGEGEPLAPLLAHADPAWIDRVVAARPQG